MTQRGQSYLVAVHLQHSTLRVSGPVQLSTPMRTIACAAGCPSVPPVSSCCLALAITVCLYVCTCLTLADSPTSLINQVVEEEVFESECFVPLRGWSHTHLLAGDRQRFNRGRTGGGDSSSFPQLTLPPPPPTHVGGAWEWEGSWEVEVKGHVDRDGWAYGSNWAAANYPFAPGCGARRPTDLVRRRRWVRRRIFKARGGTGASQGHPVEAKRRLLGVVAPGASLPLPLGWNSEGSDLQVRTLMPDPSLTGADGDDTHPQGPHPHPLLLDQHGEALHAWSVHAGEGTSCVGVDLSGLNDGDTHLLCCGIDRSTALTTIGRRVSSTHEASGQDSEGAEAARVTEALAAVLQPQWLSLTVESDALVMAQVCVGYTLAMRWYTCLFKHVRT